MIVYRVSSQNARSEKSKTIKRAAYLTTISMLVGFLVGGRQFFQTDNPAIVIASISAFAAVMTWALWRSLRQTSSFLAKAYSSFEITADEQGFTKRQQDATDVTLARAEIKRIEELQGKGFRICTGEKNRNIWVPSEIDGYEQLKAELLALPGVEMRTQSAAWLRSYLLAGALLLLIAASMLAGDRRITSGASLILAGFFLVMPVKLYQDPNFTKKGKRKLLWSVLVGIAFLGRAIALWRG